MSSYQHTTLLTKSLVFVVISSLAFALIYSSYSLSTFWVFAEPSGGISCKRTGTLKATCCQDHIINRSPSNPAGTLVTYCTDCDLGPGGGYSSLQNCSERYIAAAAEEPTPTPTPPILDRVPPGVLGDLPTVEQAPATTPPLFGETPSGGIEQPPTATTQPTPGGGANVPTEGGSAEQPPTSQDDQNDNQGGGLPTIKNEENVPPGGGVAEQPQDEGQQEDSSEGAETAGPLT